MEAKNIDEWLEEVEAEQCFDEMAREDNKTLAEKELGIRIVEV